MSNSSPVNSAPLENRNQLVETLAKGAKPSSAWRIGTELEMFGFALPKSDHVPFSPPPYKGGIGALLDKMTGKQWAPIHDEGPDRAVIGLTGQNEEKGRAISLEPAGQFEISGAPLENLFQTQKELTEHFERVHRLGGELGYGFAPLGFQPLWPRESMPWMPKTRYGIMRRYMPKVGNLGLDMMTRTCTVQVNLDFSSEEDMCRKMRVALALQPMATAIFANSPFKEGKLTGWQSMRGKIWLDTDEDRSGQPKEFFDKSFSFEAYIDWALKTPMYFIRRNGTYIDVAGASFLEWMEGRGQGILATEKPTIGDFEDHLTTLFPDVRLKTFLEMRGADAGSPGMTLGLSTFWTGLLYDQDVLEETERLVRSNPFETYAALRFSAPEHGMRASFPGGLQNFLKRLCDLSEKGLSERGLGEEKLLLPVREVIESGRSQSDHWIECFKTQWNGDVKPIFLDAMI